MIDLQCILIGHTYQFDTAGFGQHNFACIVCGHEVSEYEDSQP